MSDESPRLAPGSPAALEAGCTCPHIDNLWGRGAYLDNGTNFPMRLFILAADCPHHSYTHDPSVPSTDSESADD